MLLGLLEDEKILFKKERDFVSEDRENIEQAIENTIVEYIEEILSQKNITIKEIEKIGIAAPGTHRNGTIVKAENLGIYDFNIVKTLKKHYENIDITLNNDAKCAAMCEKAYGSLKTCDDGIFLTLGTGIGGAVFLDGKLLKPKKYTGFELGHVTIEKNGRKCACGKTGCFETYSSMRALKETIRNAAGTTEISPDEIKGILKHEYDSVKDIVENFIDYLAIGIGNYIDIFEPEIIAIGGSFTYYKEILLPKLIERLNQGKMTFNGDIPKIVVAQFGNDAGIIGATLL